MRVLLLEARTIELKRRIPRLLLTTVETGQTIAGPEQLLQITSQPGRATAYAVVCGCLDWWLGGSVGCGGAGGFFLFGFAFGGAIADDGLVVFFIFVFVILGLIVVFRLVFVVFITLLFVSLRFVLVRAIFLFVRVVLVFVFV